MYQQDGLEEIVTVIKKMHLKAYFWIHTGKPE